MIAFPRNLLALLLALFAGCDSSTATTLPTTTMRLGDKLFTLEVANTDKSRESGLMNRDSMPADHGMIFVFPDERILSFWMKNTRIALDIIFVDRHGRVVSTATMQPLDLNLTSSAGPSKYAIEVNAGVVRQQKIRAGEQLQIPPTVTADD